MKNYLYILTIFLISLNSFSHGENKPGPNGGFIRMPGIFHTEVVPDKMSDSFHLFLLDLAFKNPTVKNSSVEVLLEQPRNKKVKFSCEVMESNHFYCKPEMVYSKDVGTLILRVKRDGAFGIAKYNFPLLWGKDSQGHKNIDHSSHH